MEFLIKSTCLQVRACISFYCRQLWVFTLCSGYSNYDYVIYFSPVQILSWTIFPELYWCFFENQYQIILNIFISHEKNALREFVEYQKLELLHWHVFQRVTESHCLEVHCISHVAVTQLAVEQIYLHTHFGYTMRRNSHHNRKIWFYKHMQI